MAALMSSGDLSSAVVIAKAQTKEVVGEGDAPHQGQVRKGFQLNSMQRLGEREGEKANRRN